MTAGSCVPERVFLQSFHAFVAFHESKQETVMNLLTLNDSMSLKWPSMHAWKRPCSLSAWKLAGFEISGFTHAAIYAYF